MDLLHFDLPIDLCRLELDRHQNHRVDTRSLDPLEENEHLDRLDRLEVRREILAVEHDVESMLTPFESNSPVRLDRMELLLDPSTVCASTGS